MHEYEDDYDTPEIPATVDAPQVPARQWTWNTNTLLITALGVLGAGFAIWFLMSYSAAKAVHSHAEATTNE